MFKVRKLGFLVFVAVVACDDGTVVSPLEDTPSATGGPRITGHGPAPVVVAASAQPSLVVTAARGPIASPNSALQAAARNASSLNTATQHVLWHNSADGNLGFWPMIGMTHTGGFDALGNVPSDWEVAALADFDADGKSDIVWQNKVSGVRGVWILDGSAFTGGWHLLGTVATDWDIAAAADFDGNGTADLLWQNTVTGIRVIWMMDGATFSGVSYSLGQVAIDWVIDGAADFDGDYDADILWHQTSTGSRGIWPMQGPAYTGGWHGIGIVSSDWNIASVADFTGDGKRDLIWQNTTSGVSGAWPMNGFVYTGGWQLIAIIPVEWQLEGILRPGPSLEISPSQLDLAVNEIKNYSVWARDASGAYVGAFYRVTLSNASAAFVSGGVQGKSPGTAWLTASTRVDGVFLRDSIPVVVTP